MKETKLFLSIVIILIGLFFIYLFVRRGYKPAKEKAVTSAPKIADKAVYKSIKGVSTDAITVDGESGDWQTSGINPLENLEWSNIYNMPMFEDTRRIKSVRIAYDGKYLFLLLEIDPGVEERFYKRQSSGHVGYLYLDADGSSSTGARRHIKDKYPGWDYRIYLPEGFIKKEGAPPEEARPAAWYQIERIKSYIEEKVDYGTIFNCKYEEVAGGNRGSYNKPPDIAFKGNFLEMRFPFELLKIEIPTQIRLVIEDLNALPSAEAQIRSSLNK